ncbi:MAG: DUF2252 family protein [Acidobacteriota bacterium]|nr:MAG: DUF2252 family protein [Acidobacteriota bacterium]
MRRVAAILIGLALTTGGSTCALVQMQDRDTPNVPSRFAIADSDPRVLIESSLLDRLRSSPFAYFRFFNRQWSQAVCDAFGDDPDAHPLANLHGDAHLEQYAVTETEHGLDDFDDSASGPAVIDLVRFSSSVYLVCTEFRWEDASQQVIDQFFNGYREGLRNSDLVVPPPSIADRLRPLGNRTQAEFLAWAESLMHPIDSEQVDEIEAGFQRFSELTYEERPELPRHFLDIKRIGRLWMGIGSALTEKILARVEGQTLDPLDDVILEGKQLADLSNVSCIQLPKAEIERVLIGTRTIGRLNHLILGYVPNREDGPETPPPWWVKSWDASYYELDCNKLRSPAELAEVVYDVGVQLGQGHFRGLDGSTSESARLWQLEAMPELTPRIRRLSKQLVGELIDAWETFKSRDFSPVEAD